MSKEKAGILVDEQFGAAILRDAAAHEFVDLFERAAIARQKEGTRE